MITNAEAKKLRRLVEQLEESTIGLERSTSMMLDGVKHDSLKRRINKFIDSLTMEPNDAVS